MHKFPLACLAAGLVGLAALPASAALSANDRDFAMKAASDGLAEVQASQLAQQRATSPQVKQFAQRMVADHSQANDKLMQIAQQQNLDLPTQPASKDTTKLQKLRGLNGSAFDQAYAQEQVPDHQSDIALFRKEAQSGQDPALKSFAQQTLPILQQHLQLAEGLNTNR